MWRRAGSVSSKEDGSGVNEMRRSAVRGRCKGERNEGVGGWKCGLKVVVCVYLFIYLPFL